MKLLTLNFLTCARKTCKSNPAAFPLHPRNAELEEIEADLNPNFITNILPRLDWNAMKAVAQDLGLASLPEEAPETSALTNSEGEPSQILKDLHLLLMETTIQKGELVCAHCSHAYVVTEGIASFLLPSHMV